MPEKTIDTSYPVTVTYRLKEKAKADSIRCKKAEIVCKNGTDYLVIMIERETFNHEIMIVPLYNIVGGIKFSSTVVGLIPDMSLPKSEEMKRVEESHKSLPNIYDDLPEINPALELEAFRIVKASGDTVTKEAALEALDNGRKKVNLRQLMNTDGEVVSVSDASSAEAGGPAIDNETLWEE